ncbi:hypothetical protein EJ110_NYTH37484 [Nymphaea thermarum]|nr:hypothetical protein EJ110_NYTH37484 [Nymphaea thermarum]
MRPKKFSLLSNSRQPFQSCLSEDKNGMTHAIFEVVAADIVQTTNDIHRYVRCTLLNATKPFQAVISLSGMEKQSYITPPHLVRQHFGSSLALKESLVCTGL